MEDWIWGGRLDCRVILESGVRDRYKGEAVPPREEPSHIVTSQSHQQLPALPNAPLITVKMHSKIAAFLLPLLAAANPVPQSGSAPDPSQITIIDSTYSGNGCPQGSVSMTTSPDKTVSGPDFPA